VEASSPGFFVSGVAEKVECKGPRALQNTTGIDMVQSLPILAGDVDPEASRQDSSSKRFLSRRGKASGASSPQATRCVVRRRENGLSGHRRWYRSSSTYAGRLAIGRYLEAAELGREPRSSICLEL
jgi:hypothetical protein